MQDSLWGDDSSVRFARQLSFFLSEFVMSHLAHGNRALFTFGLFNLFNTKICRSLHMCYHLVRPWSAYGSRSDHPDATPENRDVSHAVGLSAVFTGLM